MKRGGFTNCLTVKSESQKIFRKAGVRKRKRETSDTECWANKNSRSLGEEDNAKPRTCNSMNNVTVPFIKKKIGYVVFRW